MQKEIQGMVSIIMNGLYGMFVVMNVFAILYYVYYAFYSVGFDNYMCGGGYFNLYIDMYWWKGYPILTAMLLIITGIVLAGLFVWSVRRSMSPLARVWRSIVSNAFCVAMIFIFYYVLFVVWCREGERG
ncbi:MAG: hypothetical protein LBU87_05145 [Lactobacillales bacterium]|jgi:hypothetical protein|nr:hypothetical protein [Lactobacillales bacterium]